MRWRDFEVVLLWSLERLRQRDEHKVRRWAPSEVSSSDGGVKDKDGDNDVVEEEEGEEKEEMEDETKEYEEEEKIPEESKY